MRAFPRSLYKRCALSILFRSLTLFLTMDFKEPLTPDTLEKNVGTTGTRKRGSSCLCGGGCLWMVIKPVLYAMLGLVSLSGIIVIVLLLVVLNVGLLQPCAYPQLTFCSPKTQASHGRTRQARRRLRAPQYCSPRHNLRVGSRSGYSPSPLREVTGCPTSPVLV